MYVFSTETKDLICNFFKKNENNNFSEMSDKEIVDRLKAVGFSLNDLYHCNLMFISYLCPYPLQNGGLSIIPQQIRNGINEFANLLDDDETKPLRPVYLAYYPSYLDFVNYVFTLHKLLKKGELIAPENYQGTAFDAFSKKLTQLEENFHAGFDNVRGKNRMQKISQNMKMRKNFFIHAHTMRVRLIAA